MAYVFSAPGQVVLPVVGLTDLFPVRRIYCVGRNYADHAREMGHSGREAPFFFAKPADAVLAIAPGKSATLPFPAQTGDLQYETELVVALGRGGTNIATADAPGLVWGYAVGIDLTRRDLQSELKRQGRPWEISKSFDHSAPISAVRPVTKSGWLEGGRIWLDINGQRRQDSDISCMIWGVNDIIAHLSRYFALAPGDLIFTGTPAGVAAVRPGDVLRAGVDGVGELTLEIGDPGP
jgi:fumarylpyruvate hydrolase